MAVYVDEMKAQYRGMVMCHMLADSTRELLWMARRIGVQQRWLQDKGSYKEHFDICASKRQLAIAKGAVVLTRDQLAKMLQQRREMWLQSRIQKNNPPSVTQEPTLAQKISADYLVVHPLKSDSETLEEKNKS